MRRFVFCGMAIALVAAVAAASALPAHFNDPLQTPSMLSELSKRTVVQAVTQAGDAFIAVGPRGQILKRTAGSDTWKQIAVPVSSDLVAVSFPSPRQGWAVGHDGVVLHSTDGGQSWQRQLDGLRAYETTLAYYEALAKQGVANVEPVLKNLRHIAEQAPAWPFLDVWFRNDDEGYIVGAFGLIMRTVDGGVHWTPLLDKIDNPRHFHLYSVRGTDDGVFIAGEQGLVFKLDPTNGRFVAVKTPYNGSFFGVSLAGDDVVVFGLRGHAFVSVDRGVNWERIETNTDVGISGAAVLANGNTVLATQDGHLLLVRHGEHSVARVGNLQRQIFGVAAAGANRLVVATSTGPEFATMEAPH